MSNVYCVRIDVCGSIGCYVDTDQHVRGRGDRVVCFTDRGLEVGEVLMRVGARAAGDSIDGEVLRRCSVDDERRWTDQQELRRQAVSLCQQLLQQANAAATVLDAVLPLEGQYICFYLLGEFDERTTNVARDIGTRLNLNVLVRPAGDRGTCGKGSCGESAGCSSAGCGGGCSAGGEAS